MCEERPFHSKVGTTHPKHDTRVVVPQLPTSNSASRTNLQQHFDNHVFVDGISEHHNSNDHFNDKLHRTHYNRTTLLTIRTHMGSVQERSEYHNDRRRQSTVSDRVDVSRPRGPISSNDSKPPREPIGSCGSNHPQPDGRYQPHGRVMKRHGTRLQQYV